MNQAIDSYSKEPISKYKLLESLQSNFDLHFKFNDASITANPTGIKSHYYSCNKFAQSLGYEPKYTSLEGITSELSILLDGKSIQKL